MTEPPKNGVVERVARALATAAVRHPAGILAGVALFTLLALGILLRWTALDSDILNLLPSGEPSVQALRDYERSFGQAGELAFLLVWDKFAEEAGECRDQFAEALSAQPWVLRVLAGPPSDSAAEASAIIPPLLLNLPPEDFHAVLARLADPAALKERLAPLSTAVRQGSRRALFELQNDPLGIAAAALRPLWESLTIGNAFDLTSPDGTLHVVPCMTRQKDFSKEASQALMREVRQFIQGMESRFGSAGPRILVTGRAAFVEEVSSSMERDIQWTSTISLAAITVLFWIGFHRILPLAGIAFLLTAASVMAMAGGALVFGGLNAVAIGFCSILFGLGDDFSLLICQRYYRAAASGLGRQEALAGALAKAGPGIVWVSATTAIGFLALCFAGSPGFRQLGALVAMGVVLATLLMLVVLPVFLRGRMPDQVHDRGFLQFNAWCQRRPLGGILIGLGATFVAVLLVVSPWRPLRFDLSPSSIEPSHIPAARALAVMMDRLSGAFEPTLAILRNPEPERLEALDEALARIQSAGLASDISSPSALVLQEVRLTQNLAALRAVDFAALRGAVRKAIGGLDLQPAHFEAALDDLERIAQDESVSSRWTTHLPPASSWWFLLDRMVSRDGRIVAAPIQTRPGISASERIALGAAIARIPDAGTAGWSQTLAELIPWARRELFVFGGAVIGVIAIFLAWVYRNAKAWLLHVAAMAASLILTLALLKLFDVRINILNALAFPLLLGVGVDYGTHIILASREAPGDSPLANTLKPVLLSGLTTACGFGALVFAGNPALRSLGALCALGVCSCLFAAFFLITPGAAWLAPAPRSPVN